MANPFPRLPVWDPRPDAARFVDVVMGRRTTERAPLVEYLIDDALRRVIVAELLGRQWVPFDPSDAGSVEAYLDNFALVWYHLGYDVVRYEEALPFRYHSVAGSDGTAMSGRRTWRDMHHGAITTWQEFEQYPWPEVTPQTLANYEYLDAHLPEGMGLMVCHAGGVLEHLSAIMSYEGLCYALYDLPDLVAAVADRIGSLMLDVYRQLVELEHVVAIFPGDDMGFRSATLLPPEALERYTLPWHTRYAELAHAHGLPYFLHSCGNLEAIMDVLIEGVRIDAKHSFENAILPVTDFHARYGDRIGVLGGVDVDILARAAPEVVRRETRALIEACHPRGRFCIGSGNSIPSYVPVDNYLAMVDEALR